MKGAGAAAQERAHPAEHEAGEGEHPNARGSRDDGVDEGARGDRSVAAQRVVERATEEGLLRHAVDEGEDENHDEDAAVGVIEELLDGVAQRGNLRENKRTDEKSPCECGPDAGAESHVGCGPTRFGRLRRFTPTRTSGQERADEPHRGQQRRRGVEECISGLDRQAPRQHERADDERQPAGETLPCHRVAHMFIRPPAPGEVKPPQGCTTATQRAGIRTWMPTRDERDACVRS